MNTVCASPHNQVPTWCVEEMGGVQGDFEELYELADEDVRNCSPSLDGVWTTFGMVSIH